jgi:hypothetical protein
MKLFGRNKKQVEDATVTVVIWPDAALDVDDDDFARAIAEGRANEPGAEWASEDDDQGRLTA